MKNFLLFVTAALLLQTATVAAAPATATVFDHYFNLQTALARDSLKNVAANARAIAEIVRRDRTGAFRLELATVSETLASQGDLIAARQVFKAVSGYVIQTFRAGRGPGGPIREMHCQAYNVNWLQRGDAVEDPYLGGSLEQVGSLVENR
jgi:hypothetical protein